MTTAAPVAPATPRPSLAAVWWQAIRPKTLAAGAVPVLVGVAVAARVGGVGAGGFNAGPALAALAGALLLQIACNLANDVFDHLQGADDDARVGPARAAQRGWLTPRQLGAATGLVLLLAVADGAWLVARSGWPILALGVAGVFAAIAYTARPFALGYRGLGDVLVFAFFGPAAVVGTVFVQTGTAPAAAWLASVPIGALATAILVVNNVRDRHTDARTGKRTLAVRLGARGARWQYGALLALAFAVPPVAWATGIGGQTWLLAWLAAPMAVGCWRRVGGIGQAAVDGPALNAELGATARLLTLFGVLLAAGIAL